jgi:hypothetical protein
MKKQWAFNDQTLRFRQETLGISLILACNNGVTSKKSGDAPVLTSTLILGELDWLLKKQDDMANLAQRFRHSFLTALELFKSSVMLAITLRS